MENGEAMGLFEALVIGGLLSIPYGLGNWLLWQRLKVGSLIPAGSFTQAVGGSLGGLMKLFCFACLVWAGFYVGWYVCMSLVIVWVLGGWTGTCLERLIYGSSPLDRLESHASQLVEEYGEEEASRMWAKVMPRWWVNRMSERWEKEYAICESRLTPLLDAATRARRPAIIPVRRQ